MPSNAAAPRNRVTPREGVIIESHCATGGSDNPLGGGGDATTVPSAGVSARFNGGGAPGVALPGAGYERGSGTPDIVTPGGR